MLVASYYCLIAAAALGSPPDPPALVRYRFTRMEMGMPFGITLYAADERSANAAAEAAFARIHELNSVLSDYDPTSELSRLSDTSGLGRAIPLSEPLWHVLFRSQQLSERSNGAFDVTVGPVIKLWRRARRMNELPAAERLSAALQAVGYRHMRLDPQKRTAQLTQPQMRLDLGGIAVGYAVDEALAVLRKRGITRAMVDGSGDIGVGDAPPGSEAWRIGLTPPGDPKGVPQQFVSLVNHAITTSGDAFQFVEIDGTRYSHIVDPKTGLGLISRCTVTVIAPDCITADSLATAASVLGSEKGLKLVDDTPGAAAMVVRLVDGKPQVNESPRFGRFVHP